jgi:succinate dehydrogenase / fumarate reductase cytochrome b subunit
MNDRRLCRFLGSTVGAKVLMAATGVVLFGYVVGHVSGNMLIFAGREAINKYSEFLHTSPFLLWGTRVVLLASVLVHVWASIRLTKLKADARPVPYAVKEPRGSTYAARTMMWSGPILALFVVYHILHLTTGTVHREFNPYGDVYHNLVTGFRNPLASGIYIVAMLALALHLSHGVWSMLQTVGVNRPHWEKGLRRLAVLFGVLVSLGFIAVPVAVLLRIVA